MDTTLSGRWHGAYSYPRELTSVYFVADLHDTAGLLTGASEEAERARSGAPLALRASLLGRAEGSQVVFTKTYDGSGGWHHSVQYDGSLSSDGMEIDGRWHIPGVWSGTFLMIRSEGVSEAVVREAFETVRR
jgi:hypothetical protein